MDRTANGSPPFPHGEMILAHMSIQHWAGGEAQRPTTAGAEQTRGHTHHGASNPIDSPAACSWMTCLDPTAHQVVRENFEKKCSFVGVEIRGGDLADSKTVLELRNERLDPCAVVIKIGELVEVPRRVVRHVHLHRPIEIIPQACLSAAVALGRTDGKDAVVPFRPIVFADETPWPHYSAKGEVAASSKWH